MPGIRTTHTASLKNRLRRALTQLPFYSQLRTLERRWFSRHYYYRQRNLLKFHRQFLSEGDLCFHIGANMGSRTECMLRIGAQVVAVEPQPLWIDELRRRLGSGRN